MLFKGGEAHERACRGSGGEAPRVIARSRIANAPRERSAPCLNASQRRRGARESVSGVWGRSPQSHSAFADSERATRTECAWPKCFSKEARRTRERVGVWGRSPQSHSAFADSE